VNPDSKTNPAQAAFDQGIALINKGDHRPGEARLEEAARLGHLHAAKALVAARLGNKVVSLARAGQRDLALACLNDAQRLTPPPAPELIAQLRQFVDQLPEGKFAQPQDKNGWNNMGSTLMEAGKLWEAVACFKKAIDLDSTYENAWLNLGLAFGRFKEYENALAAFNRLLTLKPDSFHGWNLKGMILGNLKKQDEAVACYNRALELNPRLAEAWFNKSLALLWLNRLEETITCCDRALELDPRHLKALLNKAKALNRLGRESEVLGCYAQMNRIDPIATEELLKMIPHSCLAQYSFIFATQPTPHS